MSELLLATGPPKTAVCPDPLRLTTGELFVIEFQRDAESENLSTGVEQRELAEIIQQGDAEQKRHAMGRLLRANRGLIATVVYYHNPLGDADGYLLKRGGQAILKAAATYDLSPSGPDFNDHAVILVEDAVRNESSDPLKNPLASRERPMEGVLQFIADLGEAPNSPATRLKALEDRERKARVLEQLTSGQRSILPFTHLPGKEASKRIPSVGLKAFRDLSLKAQKRLGVSSQAGLALAAYEAGIQFEDIVELVEPLDQFSLVERQVSMRLDKKNPAIAEELKLSPKQTGRAVESLLKKTKARSRGELLVMAHMNGFEPSEEELVNPIPDGLRVLTPLELERLQWIHVLTSAEIASKTGTTERNINTVVDRCKGKLGGKYPDRTTLALELHERGMQFEIIAPRKPLAEILEARDISIALSLGNNSYEDIGKAHNLSATQIYRILRRMVSDTGARTIAELALMVREHDTSEQIAV